MSFVKIRRMRVLLAIVLLLPAVAAGAAELRLATTTSTENSGLLAHLLPDFEQLCRCEALVIAVGTGRALKLGERGDADVLLVHSPPDEERFVAEGFGINRRAVMFNDFVLLGPPDDPAGVVGGRDVAAAMTAIADARAKFVSRGDESGTHKKEKRLWALAGFESDEAFSPEWYVEAGVGMGQAIIVADELRAYLLSDRGTYLFFRDKTDLTGAVENEPRLHNPYSVIAVNPAVHPGVAYPLAVRFIKWLTSEQTRARIAAYRVRGERLFFPPR